MIIKVLISNEPLWINNYILKFCSRHLILNFKILNFKICILEMS